MTDGILGNAQRKEELIRKIEELKNEEIIPEVEMGEYIYGKIEDMLVEACLEYPPDFEKIKGLFALKPDINMVVENALYENVLSAVISRYNQVKKLREIYCEECKDEDCTDCSLDEQDADGRYLPQIVQMFIDNGFDVKGHNDRLGAVCLYSLLYSSDDKYILDVCRILLYAGANPKVIIYNDSPESVLEWVNTKMSFYEQEQETEKAELFKQMYSIMAEY